MGVSLTENRYYNNLKIITLWEKQEQMNLNSAFDPCEISSRMIKLVWNNTAAVCQAGFLISLQISVRDNIWN